MTERSLARFICRLFALYLFVRVVLIVVSGLAPALVFLWPSDFGGSTTLLQLIASLFIGSFAHLILALFIWHRADYLARLMTPDATAAPLPSLNTGNLLAGAFAVVGLVLSAEALALLVRSLAVVMGGMGSLWGEPLGAAIQLGLGLWLLLNANRLVAFLDRRSSAETLDEPV